MNRIRSCVIVHKIKLDNLERIEQNRPDPQKECRKRERIGFESVEGRCIKACVGSFTRATV